MLTEAGKQLYFHTNLPLYIVEVNCKCGNGKCAMNIHMDIKKTTTGSDYDWCAGGVSDGQMAVPIFRE